MLRNSTFSTFPLLAEHFPGCAACPSLPRFVLECGHQRRRCIAAHGFWSGTPGGGDHAADRVRDANSLNSEDLKRGSSLNKHPRDYTCCLLD